MAYKTKVTIATENLVAYDTVKRTFDAITKRADRRLKPLATEVYDRLQSKQKFSKDAIVTADYRFEDKDKARTQSEGIKEFKQRHPKYGRILQGIIDETRQTKKRFLEFGLVKKATLPEEIYFSALESIGIPESQLETTLETALELSSLLNGKREDGLTEMLMK
ncbi:hypothetical protein GOV04_03420 [Candidatus Woesearchaeota archaeon]|nr:hypothetical protein [Candidatus Woesearchaeota archaeon]